MDLLPFFVPVFIFAGRYLSAAITDSCRDYRAFLAEQPKRVSNPDRMSPLPVGVQLQNKGGR